MEIRASFLIDGELLSQLKGSKLRQMLLLMTFHSKKKTMISDYLTRHYDAIYLLTTSFL